MGIRKIVREYLKAHGYDGLYNYECGCAIDDLMPCDASTEDIWECEPGYARKDDPDCIGPVKE